ncbi:hypothetical protein L208DRAFT_1266800, partial [Tricholoma matsutake]
LSFLGPEKTRGMRSHILEISGMLCSRRRARLQCILVAFEGPDCFMSMFLSKPI